MPNIFYLKGIRLSKLDKYATLIKDLADEKLKPGAKPERLKLEIDIEVYSVRLNNADRLLYTIIKDGPDKGSIVICGVADDHNYDDAIRKLKAQMGHELGIRPYPEMPAAAAADEDAAPKEYAKMHYFGEHCIEFDVNQKEVLRTQLPVIIHGAPGTGKTVIGANIAINYIQNPTTEENADGGALPLKSLFLFPTQALTQKTKESYLAACEFYGIDKTAADLVEFSTYADFFKNRTREGQNIRIDATTGEAVPTGFADFEPWYNSLSEHKKLVINDEKLSAPDCWASFRICSLYSDSKTRNKYKDLGKKQCDIPSDSREKVYDLYLRYKTNCEEKNTYSPWVSPFSCDEKFGLVILDESHNQSGATVLSAYNLAQYGHFVALVGDHQRIGEHQSLYSGGYTAADLLTLLIHETNAPQDPAIKFETCILPQTHRNSAQVVAVVNYFVNIKKLLGLSTLIKGADCSLNGNNGHEGESSVVFTATNKLGVTQLRERFLRNPDVAIIVPADSLDEARKRWPGNMVFSAVNALGLEFPYVICEGLLADADGSLKVGKLLKNPLAKVATEGHRAKNDGIKEEASEQEPWFTNLITACSRATDGVYFIEDENPKHTAIDVFDGLQKICDKHLATSENAPQNVLSSTPDELHTKWLTRALELLQSNNGDMAKNVMAENVPEYSTFYKEFLAEYHKYNATKQSLAAPVVIATQKPKQPVASSIAAANTTDKPKQPVASSIAAASTAAKPQKQPVSSSIAAASTTTKPKQPVASSIAAASTAAKPKAPSQAIKATVIPRVQVHAAVLFDSFNEDNLITAIKECNLVELPNLFKSEGSYKGKKIKLFELLVQEEKQKIFMHCCCENIGTILAKVSESKLGEEARKYNKKLNPLFQRVANVFNFIDSLLIEGLSIGNLPLEMAVKKNNLAILQTAHWAGFNLINFVINKSHRLIHLAAQFGHIEIMKFLYEAGADLDHVSDDDYKLAPAQIAVQFDQVEILEFLFNAGVNLNEPNALGYTSACIAAQFGNVKTLKFLHEAGGADLNQVFNDSVTLSFIAAKFGQVGVMKYLHDNGVDLNQDSMNPIFIAARIGALDVIKFLLSIGCNSKLLFTSTEINLSEMASTVNAVTLERMKIKIAERILAGDLPENIELLPQDIAEVMGHEDIYDILKEHAAQEVSMAALLMPHSGSMFAKGDQSVGNVVTSSSDLQPPSSS